ncbi:MAG: hypothetical protein ASARMPRED_004786 [Alectoria sarmentosa]|nr:MAG: hypothetical protein ASARMPRED_004786 [Alectoria sarmentosa]
MARTVVQTAFSLRKMLDDISLVYESRTPALFLHADGRGLCRTGPLAILELHIDAPNRSHTYLVHVHFLEDRAFTTLSTNGQYTLKAILEEPKIPKVFFDVRMDADALYAQYDITLAGIIDLQLMELSARAKRDGGSDGRLHSLETCFDNDSAMNPAEVARFKSFRNRGKARWDPALGGSYDVFELQSLFQEIFAYCEANVQAMPRLFEVYNSRLDGKMDLTEKDDFHACRILSASRNRVIMAQGPPRPASSNGPWNDWNGGYWTL